MPDINPLKNAVASAAQEAVTAVATHFGAPAPVAQNLASTIHSVVQALPLPVPPTQPGGPVGQFVHDHAAAAIQAVGQVLGHPQVAQHIGAVVSAASNFIPFSAVPQATLAPQGIFGSLIGALAPTVGSAVGGLLGNSQLGQQIGSAAGTVSSLLPFSAVPSAPVATLAPQGIFGDLVSKFAPTVGSLVGNVIGQPQLGQQIGTMAGHVGGLLPFSAVPTVPAAPLAPQGIFGDLVSKLAPTVGSLVGNVVGQPQLGQQIGTMAGHVGGLLPFSAVPTVPVASLAPQGIFGDLVSKFAPTVGSLVGNVIGQPQLGQQIGTMAGHVGGLLPFSAVPTVYR